LYCLSTDKNRKKIFQFLGNNHFAAVSGRVVDAIGKIKTTNNATCANQPAPTSVLYQSLKSTAHAIGQIAERVRTRSEIPAALETAEKINENLGELLAAASEFSESGNRLRRASDESVKAAEWINNPNCGGAACAHVTVNCHKNGTQNQMERYRHNNPCVGTLATQIDAGAEQIPRLVLDNNRVRYLTPLECERLQGFPADYTAGFSDSRRYRMLGNSMPVPVIRWLGERILAVEQMVRLSKAG